MLIKHHTKMRLQARQKWRHDETLGLYYITDLCKIKTRNWYFKRVWVDGVIYHSHLDHTQIYVRTQKDFYKRFTFIHNLHVNFL